jgi:hypothetical protein
MTRFIPALLTYGVRPALSVTTLWLTWGWHLEPWLGTAMGLTEAVGLYLTARVLLPNMPSKQEALVSSMQLPWQNELARQLAPLAETLIVLFTSYLLTFINH